MSEILYLNVCGLMYHFDEICVVIEGVKPFVVVLVETHLTEEVNPNTFNLIGYTMFNCFSHSKHTGGVTIYVQNVFKVDILLNAYLEMNWILILKLRDERKSIIVGGIYHSPSASDARFIDILENLWLSECVHDDIDNIFCGDFNINFNCKAECRELKRVMDASGFRQVVSQDTRITVSSSTRIDLVFTNIESAETTILSDLRISDHESVSVFVGLRLENAEVINTQMVNDWSRYNRNELCQIIESSLPSLVCSDFNELVNRFDFLLRDSVKALVNEKSINKKLVNHWYHGDLRQLKTKRDNLYKQFLSQKCERRWLKYKMARNEYSQKIKEAKNISVQNELERNKNNGKLLWKSIKRLANPNGVKVESVCFDGAEYTNESDIAEKFNNYFIDSVMEIHDSIAAGSNVGLSQINYNCGSLSSFENVSFQEFWEIVNNMKPTAGIDNVSLKVFKDSLTVLASQLIEIINTSLQSGIMPDTWKFSTVIPVQKQKNTREATLYRPINMLELQEKVLELAVKRQLVSFIESGDILIDEQSGFRKKHSTETAVNLLLRNWKGNIEKGNYTVAVFLDFKRAFETIDRMKLLEVLVRIGINGTALKWFQSYLGKRMQRTKFGSAYSQYRENKLGVPQGSVLGPILFILYINDLKMCLRGGHLKLFADDSVSYWTGDNLDLVMQKANADLENITEFLKQRKLCLNLDKTNWMIIGNRKIVDCPSLLIDGCIIERVCQTKYLGIQVDEKLNFIDHVDYTIKKIAIKYGVLCRINRFLTFWSKIIYVKSVIMPHFDYCSTILLHASDSQIKRLQRIQNKIMRIVIRCNRYTPSAVMLDMLQWLSVKQRIAYNSLMFVHKIKNGMLPSYLTEDLQYGNAIHSHNTRRARDFRLPTARKEMTKRSIFYNGLKMYNSLPQCIKDCTNIVSFKKMTVHYVKHNI